MKTLRAGFCFRVESLADRNRAGELKRADLLVLPELADGGYAALAGGAPPHTTRDNYYLAFADLTRQHGLCCIAGSSCVASPSGRRTNSSLVYHRGRLVHRYDKVHLFRPTGDDRYFSPGKSYGTFTVNLEGHRIRAGVVICYDLRFPELVRAMARDGMEILIVPARWPKVRDEAWQTLLKARAMENQIFVLGCNAKGDEGGFSYAFDPTGGMIFSNRGQRAKDFGFFTIDLGTLAKARRLHDNIRDAVLLRQTSFPPKITSRPAQPSSSASRRSAGR
jgi:omega-amidase